MDASGVVLKRQKEESGVSGDPCIVWDEPIEWVKDIPKSALDAGEGYNLWRQFVHLLPDGRAAQFYNSGYYGREQLYLKVSEKL